MRGIRIAATVIAALVATGCGASDDSTTASRTAGPTLERVPRSTASASPAPNNLIKAAKPCMVVTKAILDSSVEGGTFTFSGEGEPAVGPAYNFYEQRCGYSAVVGGQFNDNPNTPNTTFTITVSTYVDDRNGTQWAGMALISGHETVEGVGDDAFTDDMGVAARKGRVIVTIQSTDDTDNGLTNDELKLVMKRSLANLKATQ